jgi:hypothetical protein
MKLKILGLALAIMMVISLMSVMSSSASAYTSETKIADMIAGGGNTNGAKDVGDIFAWNDGTNLYVKYQTTGIWGISETHLAVEVHVADMPLNKNNLPQNGLFEYGGSFSPMVQVAEYTIPLASIGPGVHSGANIFIAAHAVVQKMGGVEALALLLPAQVTACFEPVRETCYFDVHVTNGGWLDGTYPGWCIDTDSDIMPCPITYLCDVYSSYGNFPAGLVEHPENFDLVNWILNQNYVGATSPGGFGTYTYGDVQRAIWALLDDEQSDAGLGAWDQNRVDEILTAAAGHDGFVPVCGQYMAVILVPDDGSQPSIIPVRVPCGGCSETAWGIVGGIFGDVSGTPDGLGPQNKFNAAKNWSEYIPYHVS